MILGAFIGILALRFTADLFIYWLKIYKNLEDAGYIAVLLVSLKLICEVLLEDLIPEYVFFIVLISL